MKPWKRPEPEEVAYAVDCVGGAAEAAKLLQVTRSVVMQYASTEDNPKLKRIRPTEWLLLKVVSRAKSHSNQRIDKTIINSMDIIEQAAEEGVEINSDMVGALTDAVKAAIILYNPNN